MKPAYLRAGRSWEGLPANSPSNPSRLESLLVPKVAERLVRSIADKCHYSFAVLVDVRFFLVGGHTDGKSI